MKRYVILLLLSLLSLNIIAGDKIHVSMVKQYIESDEFILPKKTIEKKMNCLKIANPKYNFTKQLLDLFNKVQRRDDENYVFAVDLQYYGKGISITLTSSDILDNDTTTYYGDIMVDRKHFVLIENDDNRNLLKLYFKKNSGQTVVFQRLFEKTETIIEPSPSSLYAIYDERAWTLDIKKLVFNGEDTTQSDFKEPKATQKENTDEDDALKIDVELFDE